MAEALVSAPALLLHAWRLRRIRRAMRALRRSVDAYQAAYGREPFTPADPQA